jgi:putative SOS response-associated peptidase YedK
MSDENNVVPFSKDSDDEKARRVIAEAQRLVHDRMPLVLAPADYGRWLSDELDPATVPGRADANVADPVAGQ